MNQKSSFNYRIYYEDTDSGGVVYYANYLKFFERARTDSFRQKGIIQSSLAEEQAILFVVTKCSCQYKVAAKLDDLVTIETQITKIGKASITMLQEMIRQTDGKVLNILEVEIACIDKASMRIKRIPESIINLIK